jgi:translation initiation factor eIF-2B subunit delta
MVAFWFDPVGLVLLDELVSSGIECTYVHINAIGYMMRQVTTTIVGAAGFYANGTLLSRVGTAAVCALSRRNDVPVIVCCETVKFSDRSQIDSFVYNEIGDPDALVRTQHHDCDPQRNVELAGWRDVEPLNLLNILYDVTPAEYVTVVIAEIGLIPVTSIPVVLREYSSALGQMIIN